MDALWRQLDAIARERSELDAAISQPLPPAPAADSTSGALAAAASSDIARMVRERLRGLQRQPPSASSAKARPARADGRPSAPQAAPVPAAHSRARNRATTASAAPAPARRDADVAAAFDELWSLRAAQLVRQQTAVERRTLADASNRPSQHQERVHVAVLSEKHAAPSAESLPIRHRCAGSGGLAVTDALLRAQSTPARDAAAHSVLCTAPADTAGVPGRRRHRVAPATAASVSSLAAHGSAVPGHGRRHAYAAPAIVAFAAPCLHAARGAVPQPPAGR